LWPCDGSSDAQRTCRLNHDDNVFHDVGGFLPGANQGGWKSAPLQERSRYVSALPFWESVCDEAPVHARSLCAGEALAAASGGSLLGCRFASDVSSKLEARQNGENVNPKNLPKWRKCESFGAIASVAGDRSGPWTGWIGLAPV